MTFDNLQFNQVPEPSSLVLALTALGAIGVRKRARKWLRAPA